VEINDITGSIVDAAKMHTGLDPGLLESMYEKCLKHELTKRGLNVESQVWLLVVYDGVFIVKRSKIDLLVEDCVIMEFESRRAVSTSSQSPATLLFKACQRRSRARH